MQHLALLGCAFLAAVVPPAVAQNPSWDNSTRSPFTFIKLTASDASISAIFLPYGATLQSLFVPDRNGTLRDVVLGYDDLTAYSTDASHPNFGPVVGRYANRIKNNTYTDSQTGEVFNSVANENGGLDTLHGGSYGWGWRPWTVTKITSDSVQLDFYDPPGLEGFPGAVTAQVVYTLRTGGVFDIDLYAQTNARTPLMLSHHDYWDLDGSNDSSVKDWVLHLPYADKVVTTDTILIPTGEFTNVTGTAYDFLLPRPIGSGWNETLGYPGLGKLGYDTCWVNSPSSSFSPASVALSVFSPKSGIKLELKSDQAALQVYTCGGQDGTTRRKKSQGGGYVQQDSCMVIEAEGVIDAINHPEWGYDQWYSPTRPYEFHASYAFSTVE